MLGTDRSNPGLSRGSFAPMVRKYRSWGTAIVIATSQIPIATRIVIGRPIRGLRGRIIALYLNGETMI